MRSGCSDMPRAGPQGYTAFCGWEGVARSARDQAWDIFLTFLLVGSVALVFWYESTEDESIRLAIERVDLVLVVFFVSEWAWRVAHARRPAAAALRWSWELLGMVPLMLPLPAALRILRLLRLVRIIRVFGRVGHAIGIWQKVAHESALHKIALASGSITVGGSLLVWAVERNSNPDLAQYSEALWWAIVTVTTVGYGDITPITTTGRVIAGVLMVTGIGTIGLLASSVASALIAGKDPQSSAPPAMAASTRVVSELERLAALHTAGRRTDSE